jgi:hypothetical protein
MCVSVCGPVYALVYPTMAGRSSCCVVCVCVCVCMWPSLCASVSHSDGRSSCPSGPTVCGPIYALVYPTVTGRSSCCVSVCGPVYELVYPTLTGRSSCCAMCVCMWPSLCASVSHSDGPFSCCAMCVCMWPSLCAGVSHSDGTFFLFCVCMWPSLCASVSHSDGRSSCCVSLYVAQPMR